MLPDEPFGDRVSPRCAHRRPDDADVERGEDGVEGGGEPRVAVADEEPVSAYELTCRSAYEVICR